jgi:hypothetical protein
LTALTAARPNALSSVVRDRLSALARPRNVAIAIIIVLFTLFASWTVNTSGMPMVFGQSLDDWYNQLATAFLHGHLYIGATPPKALTHLSDPYNPALNTALAAPFHDLALYHGHFYLAWGPTAAFMFFIPWRILHAGDASEPFAIVVFSAVGLLFTSILLCWIVDRYFSGIRTWKVAVGIFGLAGANATLFLMRRPEFYEVAITCAYCFVSIGLWGLVTGAYGDRLRPWRIGIGSASIGLAILSRVDLAVLVLFPVALGLREWLRRGRPRSIPALRFLSLFFVPVAVVVAMMLAYNHLRFGAFFQFGSIYQLAGVEQLKGFNYRLSSIAPGAFYYFVAPVQWTLAFPFFELAPPPYYPWIVPGYMQSEQSVGILTSTPILASLFLAPFLLWRRLPSELAKLLAGLAISGLIVGLVIAWGIPGTTQRYEVDFATLLTLPAVVCWFALMAPERPKLTRIVARLVGTLFVVYGAIVGMGLSITGYYDSLRVTHRATYEAIGNAFGFVPQFVTLLMGHPAIVKDTYHCGNGECGTYQASLSHWFLSNGYDLELDVAAPTGGWWVTVHMFDVNVKHKGDVVILNNASYHRVIKTNGTQRTVKIPLQGGLNRIDITVPGPRSVAFYDLKTIRIPAKKTTATSPAHT